MTMPMTNADIIATGGGSDTNGSGGAIPFAIVNAALNLADAPISVNGQNIVDVANPVADQDVATKAYVDGHSSGLTIKTAVRAITITTLPAYGRVGNVITASANGVLPAQDGVSLIVNDRLLLKNGAAGADNGIYTVTAVGSGGTPFVLTRATDADTSPEVVSGMYTFVSEGVTQAGNGWVLSTANPIVLNTTSLVFSQFSGAGQIIAGVGLNKSGNTLSIANLGVDTAQLANLAVTDAKVAAANKDGVFSTPSMRTLGVGAQQAAAGNDGRIVGSEQVANKDAAGGYPSLDGSSKIPIGEIPTGTTGVTVPFGNDARFSDARTPLAHAASHNAGGSDALAIDAAAGVGSFRTLGTSALQAAAGNDSRITGAEQTANKNQPNGYAGLDGSSKLTGSQQVYGTGANTAAQGNDTRITGAEQTANKNQPSGYAGLDGSSKLTGSQQVYGTTANTAAQGNDSRITGAEQTVNKNTANGYAGLDGSSKLLGSQQTYGTAANTATQGNDTRVVNAVQTTRQINTTSPLTGGGALSSDLTLAFTPSADVSFNNNKITNVTDPTSNQDAATKHYVDTVAQGLSVHTSCRIATAAALPTNVYVNGVLGVGATLTATTAGALTVDGVVVQTNDRILVKNEATSANQGIYVVTQPGTGLLPYILTRATDQNMASEFPGAFVFVDEGTTNSGTGWVNIIDPDTAFVVGSSSMSWSQFTGTGDITVIAPIVKTGNQLSLTFATPGTAVQSDAASASAGSAASLLHSDAGLVAATGVAVSSDTAANAQGTSTNLSRADHKHQVSTGTPTVTIKSEATSASTGTASTVLRTDAQIQAATASPTVTAKSEATVAAQGSASTMLRSDAQIQVATAIPTVTVKSEATAAGQGAASTMLRSDAQIQAATAAPTVTAKSEATAAGQGTASTMLRSDAQIQVATAAPTVQVLSDASTAQQGTASTLLRSDARLLVTTATPVAIGTSNSQGTSTSLARADHVHQGPTNVDVSGLTTTAMTGGSGQFGYVSANSTITPTDNLVLASSRMFGIYLGTSGHMTISGVVTAQFTTAGGSPSPGSPVYLAASTDEASAVGKLTATVPSSPGGGLAEVGICVDNSNYAGAKTALVLMQPKIVIQL